ncbi:hypothetical protein TIFTF001_045281 [Ficus carica]|uniref:Peptidase metallopeptidase domain-containing protein n=1 Tax=Ficus carica TaxID=3494 RepID=A0AA87YVS4_FICCA|nr:hypothetical protein TIFTF001_045281 [Ficus carica]
MLSLDTTQSQPIRRNPFAFIQNMTGGHKGEIVPGLTELKQYLQRFGYLDAEPVAVKQVDIGNDNNNLSAADDNKNGDYFDETVESAVKAYQRNYNLPVTGTLDPMTVSQMMLPRCGSPDIVNGTRRTSASFPNNQTENHDHDHDHDHDQNQLIHGVSHYSFFPGYPRWNKYQLTYRFVTGAQVPGTANIRSICARAFQRWASVSPFTFTEVPANVQSDMHIGFFRGYHGDDSPFDGNGGVLAHAYAPTVGWFH